MNKNEQEKIKSACDSLLALSAHLIEIEKKREQRVNVFRAVGMDKQEVKHSAFFAWLLNPKMPHGLGSSALKMFISRLIEYDAPRVDFPSLTNREIIGERLSEFDEFLANADADVVGNDIEVETEKVVVDKESRIDIFIASHLTKTLIVIENKVFTGAHDGQLHRYVEQINKHGVYKNYKQVYVYLSPFGAVPDEGDGDRLWCLFDYGSMLKIAERVHIGLSRAKEHAKLKILLEDYMELVDTDILRGNKELRALCKQIRREHGDALKILEAYTDNAESAIVHCAKRIEEQCPNIHIYRRSRFGFEFYTERMKAFFERSGDDIVIDEKSAKCYVIIGCKDGDITAGFGLTKSADSDWGKAQACIMQAFAPDKKAGNRYFSYGKTVLLTEDEREPAFEEVKPKLDNNIDELLRKLHEVDEKLDSMSF